MKALGPGPRSFDALIFDVDGTLADTEEMHRCAFNAAFRQHDLKWQWDAAHYARLLEIAGGKERLLAFIASLQMPALERQRFSQLVPALHACKTQLFANFLKMENVVLRTGVRRLITEARASGVRLGIASTTSRENVDALLAATFAGDSSPFDVIVTGDAAPRKKPAPDVYRLALEALGVSAERAIAIEDSAIGLQSARAAGLFTVVTSNRWTAGQDFAAADLRVDSLGDPDRPLAPVDAAKVGASCIGIAQLVSLHAAAGTRVGGARAKKSLSELVCDIRIMSFDLDGTLIDTALDLASSVNLMLTKLGIPNLAESEVKALVGNGVEQLVASALAVSLGEMPGQPMLGTASDLFGQIYREHLFVRSVVYPDAAEVLQRVADRGIVVCCITNKHSRFALPLLESAGLDRYLAMTFCAESPGDRKPDPKLLLAACSTAGCGPGQMLHVGDSWVDVAAARAAGAGSIAVDYGYCGRERLVEAGPDAIVSALSTLAAAVSSATECDSSSRG